MQTDRLRHYDLEAVQLLDGRVLTRAAIMRRLGITSGEAGARLGKMIRYGLLERVDRGSYTTPGHVIRLLPELKAGMPCDQVQELLTRPEPARMRPLPAAPPATLDAAGPRVREPVPLAPFTAKRDWEETRAREEARSRAAHPAGSAQVDTQVSIEATGDQDSIQTTLAGLLNSLRGSYPGLAVQPEEEEEPQDAAQSALRHAVDQAGAMQLAMAHSNGEVEPAELFAMRRDLARLWLDIASVALTLETHPGL